MDILNLFHARPQLKVSLHCFQTLVQSSHWNIKLGQHKHLWNQHKHTTADIQTIMGRRRGRMKTYIRQIFSEGRIQVWRRCRFPSQQCLFRSQVESRPCASFLVGSQRWRYHRCPDWTGVWLSSRPQSPTRPLSSPGRSRRLLQKRSFETRACSSSFPPEIKPVWVKSLSTQWSFLEPWHRFKEVIAWPTFSWSQSSLAPEWLTDAPM